MTMHRPTQENAKRSGTITRALPTAVCTPRRKPPVFGLLGLAGLFMVSVVGCTTTKGPQSNEAQGSRRAALHKAPLQIEISGTTARPASGELFVQATWGPEPTQLGKRDEASRPGPMSLTVGDDGSLYLLDQVNRRVLRFTKSGQPLGPVAKVPETTEDIAVTGDRLYALVYERAPKTSSPGFRVERHTLGSSAVTRIPLNRSIQLVTGLFISGSPENVWVETRHDRSTLVVTTGRPLPAAEQRHQVLGRPCRGRAGERLTALRVNRQTAKVLRVDARGATLALEVHARQPDLAINALDSDALGRIYLGLSVEATAQNPARSLLLIADADHVRTLELADAHVTDAFRSLAVGANGTVYHLTTSERGVTIRVFAAPTSRAGGAS